MHGIIFSGLQKYLNSRLGEGTWGEILAAAGAKRKLYMPIAAYPDQEAVAIITAAAERTGTPANQILEDFGEFIAADLMKMYRSLLKKEWKALDMIANTEDTIHKVVRFNNPGAQPPRLKTTRRADDEVVIEYTSERRMCSVAKGIARGVGRHYGEALEISESTCMHKGDDKCMIHVRAVA